MHIAMQLCHLVYTLGPFLITCFINKYNICVCLQFSGLGHALSYTASMVIVGYYFDKHQSLASGVILAGCGMAMFAFPPLTQLLIETYGLHGAFLMLGAITFQASVFGALMRPHPLEIKQKPPQTKDAMTVRYFLKSSNFCGGCSKHLIVFRNFPLLSFLLSSLAWSMSMALVYLYLPDFFILHGSTAGEASLLISLTGIGSVTSRVMIGLAGNDANVDGKVLYMGSFGVLGILTISFPFYGTTFGGKVAYCLLLGLFSGGPMSQLTPITVELVGMSLFPTALGLVVFTIGVGYVIGPPLAGMFLVSQTESSISSSS
jgi:MCP family monocarboxylic acid transporter-like MFS transporter 12